MPELRLLIDENMRPCSAYFESLGSVRWAEGRSIDRAALDDVDVLLVRSVTRVDQALLAGSPVKFVGTATSGFDHIDRAYLETAGVGFAHAPGSNANSVVEYVLAAIAVTGQHLEGLLEGAQLGVVGYGNIGKRLVACCHALGISCRVYDPWLDHAELPQAASLEQVLACDVISLHAELTHARPWPSHHVLGPAELGSIADDALLINAGRGALIDNAALQRELTARPGLDVVLDVWEGEPTIARELLPRLRLASAHIAGYSFDGKLLAGRMLRDAAVRSLGLSAGADSASASASQIAAAATLELPQSLQGTALLRWLLAARYDIHADDTLFRTQHQDVSAQQAASNFDRLRKTYGRRRELRGSAVSSRNPTPADLDLLRGLGCILLPAADTA